MNAARQNESEYLAQLRYRPADVRRLSVADRAAVETHLVALSAEDRRLRFGAALSVEAIESYVRAIDFARDALFGLFDDAGALTGLAHVAFSTDLAEVGVSVRAEERGRGAGQALFVRAAAYARHENLSRLFMNCLADNVPMMHIARKAGMSIVIDAGDADAYLVLSPSRNDRRRIATRQVEIDRGRR